MNKHGAHARHASAKGLNTEGLHWVESILWGGERWGVGSGEGDARTEDFAVFPSRRRPHMLVPLASKRAASVAIRQDTNATRVGRRVARRALSLGMRVGLSGQMLTTTVRVAVPDGETAREAPLPLKAHLADVFGRRDLELAIHLGAVRANIKPVMQVLTPAGDLLGYAKIGWNDLTRDLIRHETTVLKTLLAGPQPNSFEVPTVLHAGPWRDLELLIVEAATPAPWYRSRAHLSLPLAATCDVARLFGTEEAQLKATPYWARERQRVTRLTRTSGGPMAERLRTILDHIEEVSGDDVLVFGASHGDWVPWNMRDSDRTLVVWDWERFVTAAPIAVDAFHFIFQVELWIRRRMPEVALRRALAGSGPLLRSLGIADADERLLLRLYILDVALRLQEGVAAGIEVSRRIYPKVFSLFSILE